MSSRNRTKSLLCFFCQICSEFQNSNFHAELFLRIKTKLFNNRFLYSAANMRFMKNLGDINMLNA